MSNNNNPTTQGAMQITVAPPARVRTVPKNKKIKRKKVQKKATKMDKKMEKEIQQLKQQLKTASLGSRTPRLQTALEKGIMEYCSCDGVIIPSRLEYLAALVCPREAEGIRLPDPYTRERTATYQTKITQNIMGVQPATPGTGPLGGAIGRFCIVVNPVWDNAAPTFSSVTPNFMFGLQDGVSNTNNWNPFWIASGANFFTYLTDPNQNQLANSAGTGFIERARPVSASILCTYNGQILNGGGNIAAAFVPGDWWQNKAVNNTYTQCNWESVALLKGAYDGPLNLGAYVIWVPEDDTDNLMRDVNGSLNDTMKIHGYPMLTVAGQVASPTNGFNGSSQLRVDIYINWEYTTENRIIETMHGSKNMNERLLAYKALSMENLSMPNDSHIDWIKTILGGVLGFALRGVSGAVLGAASGAGISLAAALGKGA